MQSASRSISALWKRELSPFAWGSSVSTPGAISCGKTAVVWLLAPGADALPASTRQRQQRERQQWLILLQCSHLACFVLLVLHVCEEVIVVLCRMSGDEVNPATVAQPVEDVQGDGRWMSQVGCLFLIQVLFNRWESSNSCVLKISLRYIQYCFHCPLTRYFFNHFTPPILFQPFHFLYEFVCLCPHCFHVESALLQKCFSHVNNLVSVLVTNCCHICEDKEFIFILLTESGCSPSTSWLPEWG